MITSAVPGVAHRPAGGLIVGVRDFFRRKPKEQAHYKQYDIKIANVGETTNPFSFADIPEIDFDLRRDQSRKVYNKSIVAKNIVKRINDNAVYTGLTWESSPLWKIIKDAPENKDEQKEITSLTENYWKLYSYSKEADYRGQFTLQQIQKILLDLYIKEGEFFVVYKYLSDRSRISPVAIQILNNDQICQPYDSEQLESAKMRGATIISGVEFDSAGKETAIYVQEKIGGGTVRIPFFGKKRRFVSHITNFPIRGMSLLSDIGCDLKDLAEMDHSVIQSAKTQAKMSMVVTADKDAVPLKGGIVLPGLKDQTDNGTEEVKLEGEGYVFNKLPPGYNVSGFNPTLPNQNYEPFSNFKKQEMAGVFGLSLSFLKILHSSSYSAGRMETIQSWGSIIIFRNAIAQFLDEFKDVVLSEWNDSGLLNFPGFEIPMIKKAWLYGSWNGIARPIVDPVKEVNAVEKRLKLGHTTGEREAKAYNGSDLYENIDRLKDENFELSEANEYLEPKETVQIEQPDEKQPDDEKEIIEKREG